MMWFWIASIPLYCLGFFFVIRSTIRGRREMKQQIAAMNAAQSTVVFKEDALKKAMDDVLAMFDRTGLKMNDQPWRASAYIIKEESELS